MITSGKSALDRPELDLAARGGAVKKREPFALGQQLVSPSLVIFLCAEKGVRGINGMACLDFNAIPALPKPRWLSGDMSMAL